MQEIHNTSEEWRAVKGFEDSYAVSSMGRVKSLERTVVRKNGRKLHVKEKMLKPILSGNKGYEYLYVTLSKNEIHRPYGIHVIVALAFPEICGLPFEGAQCNHIDEDHFNNTPENLNWLSVQDNNNHGTGNERRAKALTNGRRSKTVYQYTTAHELVKEWQSAHEIERQTGYWQTAISACCNNRYNPKGSTHNVYKNYVWSYSNCDYPKNDRF